MGKQWKQGQTNHFGILRLPLWLSWLRIWLQSVHGVTKNQTQLNDFHFHSHPYMTTGNTIVFTRWTFVGKVMSLLFNMLSRLVTVFLPRSKHLLISCLQSPSAVLLEPKKKKVCHCFNCFPIYLPWSDGAEWRTKKEQNFSSSPWGRRVRHKLATEQQQKY